jgi:hypothetical protein
MKYFNFLKNFLTFITKSLLITTTLFFIIVMSKYNFNYSVAFLKLSKLSIERLELLFVFSLVLVFIFYGAIKTLFWVYKQNK